MKYVIYTNNKSSVDTETGEFSSFFCYKSAENGNHRVAMFNALDGCFEKWVAPLANQGLIEFLGCECETKKNCRRENPAELFSEDDWLKVDLANARGLF